MSISELSNVIKKVRELEEEISLCEKELTSLKQELNHYIGNVLPDMFIGDNLTKITMDNYNLRLSHTYFVSLKDQDKALKWFKEQGRDHIFKRDLVVHCRDDEYKDELATQLCLTDYDYKVGFHWKTMSSQISELKELGIDIPDYIEVTPVSKVFINEVK